MHALLMLEDESRAVDILNQLLDELTLEEISQRSDRSGRFIHHAVVKALALRPEWFYGEKTRYLEGLTAEVSNGAPKMEHPEHWISFYQGLLLKEDQDIFFEKLTTAINQSKLEHPLYQWMQWIITQLSVELGHPVEHCAQLDDATQLFADKKELLRQRETQRFSAKKLRDVMPDLLPFHFY
jgi:hypothetical protein